MTQRTEEYRLHRGESEYSLDIEWEYHYGAVGPDGEPTEDAELEVKGVEVWGRWDGPGEDAGPGEFIEPLPLDPPLTEQEIKDFEEHLSDLACAAAEDRYER
jgi:hypothetical protein